MKRKNFKKITITLAAALMSTAIGGILAVAPIKADAAAKSYLLTDVFAVKNGTIGKSTTNVAQFSLTDKGSAYIKRDVAFKWYQSKDPSYFTTSFTLTDAKFSSVTLAVDSPSAWASEDNKASNTVTFEKTATGLDIYVNKSEKEGATNVKAYENFTGEYVNKPIVVSLSEDNCAYGQYKVNVKIGETVLALVDDLNTEDDDYVSRFVNVGQTYAEYSTSNNMYPLTIKASVPDDTATEKVEETVILFNELNKQTFNNISEDDKVTDNAPAVLVLKEEVSGFRLGTAFSLNYDTVDVLAKSTDVKVTGEYYQYNPKHTEVKYNSLSSSVIFMETQIPATETTPANTVFKRDGKEYVSIKYTVTDGSFTESDNANGLKKGIYYLAWYANADAVVAAADAPQVPNAETLDYIVLDRNEEGPRYKHWKVDNNGVVIEGDAGLDENYYVDNDKTKELKAAVLFQDKVTKAAANKFAGDDELRLEDLDKLIYDNDGYRNMKFTISYYTPIATSPESISDRTYSNLEIPVTREGTYVFKIFAQDKSGNQMQYYIDGELVTVNSKNVWDIDEIPSFTFDIKSRALKVEDGSGSSARVEKEVLDTTYNLTRFDVEGADSLKESYVLYKLKESEFNALEVGKAIKLNSISFTALKEQFDTDLGNAGNSWATLLNGKTYHEYYLSVYCRLLADGDATLADKMYACFETIGVKGDRVNNADDRWEKYKWDPQLKSFVTAEAGKYIIFADLWEEYMPVQRAAAYKIIEVSDKVDEIKGIDNWLENNLVSVILFAIAGVMLILIIILLLIKPSNETLEDVSESAAKAKKSSKKEKKD
jgi:hypothetical protein